jgi:hypothetical protein
LLGRGQQFSVIQKNHDTILGGALHSGEITRNVPEQEINGKHAEQFPLRISNGQGGRNAASAAVIARACPIAVDDPSPSALSSIAFTYTSFRAPTQRPAAVVISAVEMPPASMLALPVPTTMRSLKTWIMPNTVPSRPSRLS